MKHLLTTLSISLLSASTLLTLSPQAKSQEEVDYVSVNQMEVETICRMFTHSTGINVTATAKAQKLKCSFLFKHGTVEQAINSMCISSGLVYRKDPVYKGYQILTLEEFRKNTVFSASEKIEVFKIEPANLRIIAKSIESLFPTEAVFDDPEGVLDFSSTNTSRSNNGNSNNNNGSSNNNNRNNRNNRNVNSGGANNRNNLNQQQGTQLEVLEKKEIKIKENQNLGTQIYITVNEEHSQLIIRTANISALDKIRRLIKSTNLPLRQVLLEMKILELNVGDGEQLGVNFGGEKGSDQLRPNARDSQGRVTSYNFAGRKHEFGLGNFATEAASTFVYNFLSRDINARVQALASNNDVEVVATPMLLAVNNREANIVVGEERVIVTGASSDVNIAGDNGTRNELITVETQTRTIGTTLSVIPRINNDGTVTIHVDQENSTVKVGNNTIPVGGQNVAIDSVETANIEATVVAKNGKTIAVGGLIRTENAKSTDKVPVLGDVPLLGKAFRRDKTSSRKTELILLITPHIINGGQTHKTREILNRSKHRYQRGGMDLLDKQNEGLRHYENRADDALLPRLGDVFYEPQSSKTSNQRKTTSKKNLPNYYRHQQKSTTEHTEKRKVSRAIKKRRKLNRR